MGKYLAKQLVRRKVRRASWAAVRADYRGKGYHEPGSMNPHKSTSIKQERKKR